jgi:hypothetical protein
MTPFELFNLCLSIANRLDIQWSLFITVHMAILGGVIYVDRALTLSEKVGVLVIYTGFAVINYLITRDLIELFQSANLDIAQYATDACCRDNHLIKQVVARIEGSGYMITRYVLLLSHLVMAVLVTMAVIFDKKVAALVSTESIAEEES